jgi:hypothetical protein
LHGKRHYYPADTGRLERGKNAMSVRGIVQAEAPPRYEFSHDWFTGNIPLFQRFLASLKD